MAETIINEYKKMFTRFILDFKTNQFEELSKSTRLENITAGRQGAILVDCKDNLVPLVRTTTIYNKPAQKFLPIHYHIIENIKNTSKYQDLEFNNALIEIYNSDYRKMGYHSDQALDLANNSYICLFSCYDNPFTTAKRKLVIREKETVNCSEIILTHNSIVLFSVSTNSKWLHKIVLDDNKTKSVDGQWLGVTFRLSKTFIKFVNDVPYFYPDCTTVLKLANTDQKKEFSKYKRLENAGVGYTYPEIHYSISASDLLPIVEEKS